MNTTTDKTALLAKLMRRAHPDPRRRDGHDDPALPAWARPTIAATCLAGHAHDVKGDNDLLVLTQPDVIRAIHDAYLEAGADIIETNTFNATAIAQADYRLEGRVREINLAAARIARECADAWTARTPDKPRFVAGALGPTNRTASISPDVNDPGARNTSFDALVATYGEAIEALADGGVDLLLVETVFDTLNAKAALFAIDAWFERSGRRLPVIVSGTITDASGRTLSGQTTEAFWNSVRHARPLAVGLNCALGAALMRPYIEELARVADTYVSCYPNAGLPNPMAETGYDETPERDLAADHGFRRERLRQHRRRLLRHDARAHPRDCRRGEEPAAAQGAARRRRRIAGRGLTPKPITQCPASCASPASSRSTSATTRCSSTSASAPTSPARAPSPS